MENEGIMQSKKLIPFRIIEIMAQVQKASFKSDIISEFVDAFRKSLQNCGVFN